MRTTWIALFLLVAGCGLHRKAPTPSPVDTAVTGIVQQAARHPDDTDAQVKALAALGAPAIEPLTPVLQHPDQRLRQFAVQALGEMKADEAVDPLIRALADPSWEVRQEAVEALGRLRSPRAVQPLMDQYARDDEAIVRYDCLENLGLIADRRASPLLVRETSSDDPYTRLWAMHGLCTARAPEAATLLPRLLQDPDVRVRADVMRTCGPVARNEPLRHVMLKVMLEDPEFEIACLARENLVKDVRASATDPAARSLIEREAREAMASADPTRARRGAFLLADLGDAAAFDPLVSALHDRSPLVRHHAGYLLGEIRDSRAVLPLIGALKDPVPAVQLTALMSLRKYAAAGNKDAKAALATLRATPEGR
jgi:HEAT repeat protein